MQPILTVVGARPQFIKAAPVSRALGARGVGEYLVHTGQHYDREMSGSFFEELGIKEPDINLHVGAGSHGEQTAGMLVKLEAVIREVEPPCVLVYGDTNSTLAGALAAAKLKVPVAHVEAGLRSYNRAMPEEVNRVVTDVLSQVHFVPTEAARKNLSDEGVPSRSVVVTGDVMYDATMLFGEKALRESKITEKLNLAHSSYVLATIHRAENTDDPKRLLEIVKGLDEVANSMRVVLPLHPRTRARLNNRSITFTKVELINPLGYLDMLMLERHASVIATDSGGVQKEAYFHRVPCVTLRDETEWVELLETGWNQLVSPYSAASICRAVLNAVGKSGREVSLYGKGDASVLIARTIAERFAKSN